MSNRISANLMKAVLISGVALLNGTLGFSAATGPDAYKAELAKVVDTHFKADQWRANKDDWARIAALINQDVLDDAQSRAKDAEERFAGFGLVSRPVAKQIVRVNEKVGFGINAHTDLLAFRIIENRPAEIKDIANELVDHARKIPGAIAFIKGGGADGKLAASAAPRDIAEYVLVFIPEIGYVVEIQVITAFAKLVYENDSKFRNEFNGKDKAYKAAHGDSWNLVPAGVVWADDAQDWDKNLYGYIKNEHFLRGNIDVHQAQTAIAGSREGLQEAAIRHLGDLALSLVSK